MNKTIISLAVLTAIYQPATAATEQATENLVITANRVAQPEIDVLASVDVISREEIELLQPASVVELLNRTAGLTFVQQGGAATEMSVFMRGTNSNHILVLIDGVRVGSATTGAKSLSSLMPAQIERIEIVKGPRAALYGSDAIGGVIQIVTRHLEHGELAASVELGSHAMKKAELAAGLDVAGSTNTLTLSHETSNGFSVTDNEPDADGYNRSSASLKGQLAVSEQLNFSWLGQLDKGSYDFDGSWTNHSDYKNYLVALGANVAVGEGEVAIKLAKSSDKSENFASAAPFARNGLYHTVSQEMKAQLFYPLSNQISLTAGSDWQSQEVSSTSQFSETKRTLWGQYVSLRADLGQVKLDSAMRYDDIERVGSEVTYNVSAGYEFAPNWLLGFNHGTGFKAPTFNDLYDPWGGNPALKPETSLTNELFARTVSNGVKLEVALYKTAVDSLIEWHPIAPGSYIWQANNVADAQIKGIDLTLNTRAYEIDWQLSATFLDTEDKATGLDLIRRPQQSFTYAATYDWQQWRFSADVNYNGHSFDSGEVPLNSYTLLNTFASYQFNPHCAVKMSLKNLLDKEYQAVEGYNTPGREIGLVFSYKN